MCDYSRAVNGSRYDNRVTMHLFVGRTVPCPTNCDLHSLLRLSPALWASENAHGILVVFLSLLDKHGGNETAYKITRESSIFKLMFFLLLVASWFSASVVLCKYKRKK